MARCPECGAEKDEPAARCLECAANPRGGGGLVPEGGSEPGGGGEATARALAIPDDAARIPLQTGADALRTAMLLAFPSSFLLMGFGLITRGLAGFVVIAITGPLSYLMVREVLRRRASDLLLGDDGFRVSRGPLEGTELAWKAIRKCELRELRDGTTTAEVEGGQKRHLQQLIVTTDDGETVLAGSLDLAETQSFVDVKRILEDRAAARPEQAPPDQALAIHCPDCGAVVAPADAERVPCGSCGATVSLPPELRRKVAAASSIRRNQERVAALLPVLRSQPDASSVNRWLLAATAVVLLLVPLAATSPLLAFSVLFGTWALAHGVAGDRVALRALARCGPTAPAREGEPLRCHVCGGPLPTAAGPGVVCCVYCDAPNALGLKAVTARRERRWAMDFADLDDAMDQRAKLYRRRRWQLVLAGALLTTQLAHLVARAAR